MTKVLRLRNLDCANCAAKIESALAKLPGVTHATVNFLTQKITLEAEETRLESILSEIPAILTKIEPGCKLA